MQPLHRSMHKAGQLGHRLAQRCSRTHCPRSLRKVIINHSLAARYLASANGWMGDGAAAQLAGD